MCYRQLYVEVSEGFWQRIKVPVPQQLAITLLNSEPFPEKFGQAPDSFLRDSAPWSILRFPHVWLRKPQENN